MRGKTLKEQPYVSTGIKILNRKFWPFLDPTIFPALFQLIEMLICVTNVVEFE